MERETKKITLPSGVELELLAYITGRERRKFQGAYLDAGLSVDPTTGALIGMGAAAISKAENLTWNTVIVSLGGKKVGDEGFDVVEAVLDLRSDDYDVLVSEVNKLTSPAKTEEKKMN